MVLNSALSGWLLLLLLLMYCLQRKVAQVEEIIFRRFSGLALSCKDVVLPLLQSWAYAVFVAGKRARR